MSQHRRLYNTSRWQALRAGQLRLHPLCFMHLQLGKTVAASVVDHKIPHRGDVEMFFDAANLQSLCKPCHDAHKQAQEHNADGLLRGAGLDGRPLDPAHPFNRTRLPATQGGGEKSTPSQRQTGHEVSFAGCRNSEGGA